MIFEQLPKGGAFHLKRSDSPAIPHFANLRQRWNVNARLLCTSKIQTFIKNVCRGFAAIKNLYDGIAVVIYNLVMTLNDNLLLLG